MERILNDDEKIRRAEEIYYRRNNQGALEGNNKMKNTNKTRFKDKIFLNLLIMINIIITIFSIQNKNFIFTEEFLSTINQYKENISEQILNKFENFVKEENIKNNNDNIEEKTDAELTEIENIENEVKNENNNESSNETSILENSSSSISEMDLDVQNLKAAYTFIKPLEGVVSSIFGARESEYQNVTGYHTGIDVAAESGTPIVASMQGIVELVSNEGDYGKHIKIRCNNVTTVYAHCSKIFVKEGQIVAEGDKIANVGSTGNSTGPHLHFEIRVDDRFVDPARIINF